MRRPWRAQARSAEHGGGTVQIRDYTARSTVLDVTARHPSFLVLTQSNYPGWTATVNGKPTPIYPTDLAFSGVFVPGGNNRVVFSYDPFSFRLGLLMFIAAIVIIVTFVVQPIVRCRLAPKRVAGRSH